MQTNYQLEIMVFAILLLAGIVLLLVLLKQSNKEGDIDFSSRTKLPGNDIFSYRFYFLELGLFISLAVAYLFISWTVYVNSDIETGIPEELFEIQDFEIVRTAHTESHATRAMKIERPLEKFIVEEIMENEEPVFVDQMIVDSESSITETIIPDLPAAPPLPKEMERDIPLLFAEQMPRFPGCENHHLSDAELKNCADKKLLEFLYQNLKYPALAKENGVEGICVIRFIIAKDGTVQKANIARDVGGGCGAEALRVINLMNEMRGKWIPGRQGGIPVAVQFNLPVQFKLEK